MFGSIMHICATLYVLPVVVYHSINMTSMSSYNVTLQANALYFICF